jgi:hypothetical protein
MLPYKATESSSAFRFPLARVESSEDALRISEALRTGEAIRLRRGAAEAMATEASEEGWKREEGGWKK